MDFVIFVGFRSSVNSLEKQLNGRNLNVHVIGDSIAPRTMREAIAEGVRVGNEIGRKKENMVTNS
jgi:hypothetical protein